MLLLVLGKKLKNCVFRFHLFDFLIKSLVLLDDLFLLLELIYVLLTRRPLESGCLDGLRIELSSLDIYSLNDSKYLFISVPDSLLLEFFISAKLSGLDFMRLFGTVGAFWSTVDLVEMG